MSSAIKTLAEFVSGASIERHTASAIERAKLAMLDTAACMLLGSSAEVTKVAIRAAENWGSGPAPVYGTTTRLPAPWAALANGASAHAYDLDDYSLSGNDHSSAVLLPALLASVAASGGASSATGVQLIDAYLTGLETIIAFGEAVNMGHYNLGWHSTATIGRFGATAAVARLRGLATPEAANAIALTTSLNAGYVSQFGTMAKPLHAGLAAQAGVVAVGLATAGATAYHGALDGKVSFASLMVPQGEARFAAAFAKLGAPRAGEDYGLCAKAYPSCGYTHRAIDAAIELHGLLGPGSADSIATVTVSLPDFYLAILPFTVPGNVNEALFSTAYCVATALVTGNVTIADFSPAALQRSDVMSLAGRITVKSRKPHRPELNLDPEDPDTVEVQMRDGQKARAEAGLATGVPGKELSEAAFVAKLRVCCQRHEAGERQAAAIIAATRSLERADSLEALLNALE